MSSREHPQILIEAGNVIFWCVLALVSLLTVSSTHAALRHPLIGSELKDTLTPDQYIRYRNISAIKTQLLSANSISANQQLDSIELVHDCIKLATDVLSIAGDNSAANATPLANFGQAEKTAIDFF